MRRLRRLIGLRLTSERLDVGLARGACFVAGPAVLVVGLQAVGRMASTPGEAINGALAAGTLAVLLVVLGLVVDAPGSQGSSR